MRPSQTYWARGAMVPYEQIPDRNELRCYTRRQPYERSYYKPHLTGMGEDYNQRRISREWKTEEARFSRRAGRDWRRKRDHHMRCTYLAMGYYSLEWTTCGGWVLGPPRGEWKDYPTSKRFRQQKKRQAKRTAKCLICVGKGWVDGKQCRACLPKSQWYDPK